MAISGYPNTTEAIIVHLEITGTKLVQHIDIKLHASQLSEYGNMLSIIRSHEAQIAGQFPFGHTIFSPPNYLTVYNNNVVVSNLKRHLKTFEPAVWYPGE
ncbi:hypothetical protein EDD15DRAFT_2376643 [Pisolithus albus]|nr:hypothetical protein EDD15DRAFT_2376643 [Pisolithus albus]